MGEDLSLTQHLIQMIASSVLAKSSVYLNNFAIAQAKDYHDLPGIGPEMETAKFVILMYLGCHNRMRHPHEEF